jgi:hypothetical protein
MPEAGRHAAMILPGNRQPDPCGDSAGLAAAMRPQFEDRFPQQAKQRIEPFLLGLALPSRFVTAGLLGRFPGFAVGAENQQCNIQWLPDRPFGCGRQVSPAGNTDEQHGAAGQHGASDRPPSAWCIP